MFLCGRASYEAKTAVPSNLAQLPLLCCEFTVVVHPSGIPTLNPIGYFSGPRRRQRPLDEGLRVMEGVHFPHGSFCRSCRSRRSCRSCSALPKMVSSCGSNTRRASCLESEEFHLFPSTNGSDSGEVHSASTARSNILYCTINGVHEVQQYRTENMRACCASKPLERYFDALDKPPPTCWLSTAQETDANLELEIDEPRSKAYRSQDRPSHGC